MPEQLTPTTQEIQQPNVELGTQIVEHLAKVPESLFPDVGPEEEESQRSEAISVAGIRVAEAAEAKSLDSIIGNLDFSKDKYRFVASDSYRAEATTAEISTRFEGNEGMRDPLYGAKSYTRENAWGRPSEEAHYSHQPVEKVGIREVSEYEYDTLEKKVRARGLKGVLGFKTKIQWQDSRKAEPSYRFDYEFATPSYSEDQAAMDAGNRTGQNIRLSLKITKEQAEELSVLIAEDPKVARKILDAFVGKTGDKAMWEAEIFNEETGFINPAKRYGKDFLARDVRPRFEAKPDLQPEIVSLLGSVEPASA